MEIAPSFRPAVKGDAAALAVLVDIAGEGAPNYMWSTLGQPGQSTLEIGRDRARREEGGFSYRNATVADIGGEIAGGLVGYRLDDPYDLSIVEELSEWLRPLVRLEGRVPGSWYINVLASFPEFRRQGIAAKLLAIAEKKGREEGASLLSVIVGSWNEAAVRLYANAGYSVLAREPAILFPGCPHEGDWVLMVRSLDGSS